jgi:hypothetical protein
MNGTYKIQPPFSLQLFCVPLSPPPPCPAICNPIHPSVRADSKNASWRRVSTDFCCCCSDRLMQQDCQLADYCFPPIHNWLNFPCVFSQKKTFILLARCHGRRENNGCSKQCQNCYKKNLSTLLRRPPNCSARAKRVSACRLPPPADGTRRSLCDIATKK